MRMPVGFAVVAGLAVACGLLASPEAPRSGSLWANWLEEDARYIITPEERQTFEQLKTDEERENFIWGFWFRRDPTPDTFRNEFKVEHYRRLHHANEHFGGVKPGWKSDRGQLYISWGPPDEIESYPDGKDGSKPFELWRYAYLEGAGEWLALRFSDPMRTGEYRLENFVDERDLPWGEESRKKWVAKSESPGMKLFVGALRLPQARFKDLEELLTVRVSTGGRPFGVQTSCERVTDSAFLVQVMVALEGEKKPEPAREGAGEELQLFGRVVGVNGRVVESFEGTFPFDGTYSETLVLPPGVYTVAVAVKDTRSGTASIQESQLVIAFQ